MSYVQVECDCGGTAMIYIQEERVHKAGADLGSNACSSCGARVEASIRIKVSERTEK